MRIYEKKINATDPLPSSIRRYLQPDKTNSKFNHGRWAAFDLETTGLDFGRSKIILAGFVIFDSNNKDECTVKQFFATSRSQEHEIIKAIHEEFKSLDFVLTYNGRSFDIPFYTTKAEKYKMDHINLPYNLDLYVAIKKNDHIASHIKNSLGSLRQKAVEKYLGLQGSRADLISGGESVMLYEQYEETQDPRLEKAILLHNYDDILQLPRLLGITKSFDIDKTFAMTGFKPDGTAIINKIEQGKSSISLCGCSNVGFGDYIGFPLADKPFVFRMSSGEFEVDLQLEGVDNLLVADISKLFSPELLSEIPIDDAKSVLDILRVLEACPYYNASYLALAKEKDVFHREMLMFLSAFYILHIKPLILY